MGKQGAGCKLWEIFNSKEQSCVLKNIMNNNRLVLKPETKPPKPGVSIKCGIDRWCKKSK